jgi:TonB family protein
MSATDSSDYFIELGENNLIIARTNLSQRPRLVNELREIWLGDAAGVEAAIGEIKAAGVTGKAVTLLRLKQRSAFYGDSALAQKIKTAAGVEDFLKQSLGAENVPAAWAWVGAKDGRPPENGINWVLDATPVTVTDEAIAKIKAWAFDLLRCESAALSLAGGLATVARSTPAGFPVLFCDVSEVRTHLYLITAQGISAQATAEAGFDALAGSTQEALGLKFRGSAARLLFNETYDFADSAAKIVEPLAAGIKQSLPALGAVAPESIVCGGILAKQAWITQSLATGLGLKVFATDAGAWAASNGVSFGGNVKADTIAPSWLGLLGAVAAYEPRNPGAAAPWHPVLTATPVAAPPFVPAIAPEPPKPAVVIAPPAKSAEAVKPVAPAAVVKPAEPAPAAKPAVVITPPAKLASAAPAAPAAPAKPASQPTPVAKPTDPKAAAQSKQQPTPAAPTPKPAPAPVAAKTPAKTEPAKPSPAPAPASKPSPAPTAARAATPAPFPKKKNNTPVIIAVAVILLLGVVGYFIYSSGKTKKLDAERAIAEKRLAEEAAARQQAVEQARINEENLKRQADEARAKGIADAEALRKQAELNLKSTTERLINARGGFSVATEPAGATITISDRAPRTSPTTWNDLRLGRYDVTISLAGYDSEQHTVEIKENEVTDLGTIKLKRQTGSVDVSSNPAGLAFEIKPSGSLFVNANDVRTGQTPAKVSDLPVGNYQVSISRPNWPNYVSTIAIERNVTAQVQGTFVAGSVTITSTPTGATILRDNQTQVGVTPFTINELTPGTVNFTVTMRGMDPVTLTGKIEPGKTTTLNAVLLESDRIMRLSELDERPVQVFIEEPVLTPEQLQKGGSVQISLTVGKDGIPTDLKVEQASDPGFGRACLTAAAKWRFKPGTIKGKPVRSRVSLPFKFEAQTQRQP